MQNEKDNGVFELDMSILAMIINAGGTFLHIVNMHE